MRRGYCRRHGRDHPCTCGMGNLYRFIEPVVLYLLKNEGRSYGYELAVRLPKYALTDAQVERGALYRTLRQLEQAGFVDSEWDVQGAGPARRVYSITASGEEHLQRWGEVLANLSKSMARFAGQVRAVAKS